MWALWALGGCAASTAGQPTDTDVAALMEQIRRSEPAPAALCLECPTDLRSDADNPYVRPHELELSLPDRPPSLVPRPP